jgi:uncharacterized Zn finger protein
MATFRLTTSATINTNTRAFVIPLAAGTVAISATKTVTGTSTNFTRWLRVGDEIIVNGERRTILSITSDTSLTVTTAFTTTASGQTLTYYPNETKLTGNRVIFIKGILANTGTVLIGESRSLNADGTDITDTNRTIEILAGQQVGPIKVDNLQNVYIRSSVASQVISVDI